MTKQRVKQKRKKEEKQAAAERAGRQEPQQKEAQKERKKKELPKAYLSRMQTLLSEEYEAFLSSYEEKPKKGLRFHTGKARKETIEQLKEKWRLRPVPWCESGYYYEEDEAAGIRPGKSPYHDAGVFYIQEPSAMLPAERAEIKGTDRVLDLCAAPGGKSTQAAMRAGLLISNEYIKKRAQILSSNIERMGLRNVIVTSAAPDALSGAFPEYFDKILVDAPCSGEGMMRRDEIAVTEWSEENVALCAGRQAEILEEAYKMLRPGGRLVYSTCTFEPSENQEQAARFSEKHADLKLVSEEQFFPHRIEGEGHYCAVFEKAVGKEEHEAKKRTSADGGDREEFDLDGALHEAALRLRTYRLYILRCGLERGEWVTGKHKGERRYEPSHAEALALSAEALSENSLNLLREEDALRYLKGESLSLSALSEESYALHRKNETDAGEAERKENRGQNQNAFLPVCFDGYPLGFGKYVNGTVKNHYPKGLRRLS